MADNNINIPLKGTADFSQVYAQLNALKASIAAVNKESSSLSNVSIDSKQIDNAQKSFINTISAIKGVRVEMVGIAEASAHLNTRLLENKRSISEMATTYRQGKNSIVGDIEQIAQHQAKLHQSMVVPSAVRNGQAAVVTNFNEVARSTLVNEMRLKAYNTEMLNLSNRMLNFGKNTQWAGRQLTVGLTVPLLAAGGAISAMFMSVDQNMRKLLSVYGVGGTAHGAFSNILPSPQELNNIKNGVTELSKELAKMYGQSAATTTSVAADLAAAGYTQQQLLDLTKTVTNAMVVGQTDQDAAVKATIAIQNTYRLNIKQTGEALNFFSAAQAATSTNMKDLIDAVPRVGPIMQNLGGTYKDTVAMIVAMKEGGVAAGEGANALKNSLQRIVAPTKSANDQMKAFGINLSDISKSGSPVIMIEKLQKSLDKLDPVARQVAITDLFGKFQAARITALLDNFNRTGTQSAKVMQMMNLSAEDLGKIQQNQLNTLQQSPSMKFQSAIENLKAQLIPIGEKLIEIATPLVNAISWLVQAFQNIGPIKYLLAGGLGIAAIAGPIIMFVGLISNLGAQLFKIVNQMRMFREGFSVGGGLAKPFNALKEGIKGTQNYLEKFDAAEYASAKAAKTLESTLQDQKDSWTQLTSAMEQYRRELENIRNIGNSGPLPPPPGGGSGDSPGGVPRLPVGGPMAPAGIVGEASRPVHVEALNVNLANQRGKLTVDGGGEIELAHMRPMQQTVQGSNVLNISGYDPRSNAQGSFGIVPSYMTSGVGQTVNTQLGNRAIPVIPPNINNEQVTRQILEQLGVPNITDAMVKKIMQEFSLENLGGLEAGKIAQMQGLARLQNNPAAISQFKAIGSKEGATPADIEAFFAQKLGVEWDTIKQDAAQQILRLYEIAQQETEQAVKSNRVATPQNIQQQLSLTGERFSELISEQYIQISSTYSEAMVQSLTIASTDFANITEQMKRKVMVKLVNAGAATESMMNPLVSALESLIQQVRATTNQLTAEAKTATAQVASATARGASGKRTTYPLGTPWPISQPPPPTFAPISTTPPKLATGGKIYGPGGPKDDLIPALLSNGEYVVKADAVGHYGSGFMDAINHKKLAGGGIARFAGGTSNVSKSSILQGFKGLSDEDIRNVAFAYGYAGDNFDQIRNVNINALKQWISEQSLQRGHMESFVRTGRSKDAKFLLGNQAMVPTNVNQVMADINELYKAADPITGKLPNINNIVGESRRGQWKDYNEIKTTSEFTKKLAGMTNEIGKFTGKNIAFPFENPYNNKKWEASRTTHGTLARKLNETAVMTGRLAELDKKRFEEVQASLIKFSDYSYWKQSTIDQGKLAKEHAAEIEKARLLVARKANGGKISGPGGPKDDVIPAMLSNGEYVINADAVKHYGKGFMDSVNTKKLASGGGVGHFATGSGGDVSETVNQIGKMKDQLSSLVMIFKNLKNDVKAYSMAIDGAITNMREKRMERSSYRPDSERPKPQWKPQGGMFGGDWSQWYQGGPKPNEENLIGPRLEDGSFIKGGPKNPSKFKTYMNKMSGGPGMMAGMMLSPMISEASAGMEQNSGGPTAATSAMNYGGQALSATMMFGPEVAIPATLAAVAFGAALGKEAEQQRAVTTAVNNVITSHQAFRDSLSVSQTTLDAFGLHAKSLSDIKFSGLAGETDQMTQKINELANAMQNGQKATVDFMKNANPKDQQKAIQDQYLSVIMAGGKAADARIAAAAAAKAYGLTGYQSKDIIDSIAKKYDSEKGNSGTALVDMMKNAKTINLGGMAAGVGTAEAARLGAVGQNQSSVGTAIINQLANPASFITKPLANFATSRGILDMNNPAVLGATSFLTGNWLQGAMKNVSQQGWGHIFDLAGSQQVMGTGAIGQSHDWAKELNLASAGSGFNINDLVSKRSDILGTMTDKSGKDLLASGDQNVINMAKMAGITSDTNIQDAADALDKLKQKLDALADPDTSKGAQEAIQTFVEGSQDFKAQFSEPIAEAVANMKSSDLKKVLPDALNAAQKAGGTLDLITKQVAEKMGPEFAKLAPQFNQSTAAATSFLSALNLIAKDAAGFTSQAAAAQAAAAAADLGAKGQAGLSAKVGLDQATSSAEQKLSSGAIAAQNAEQIKSNEQAAMKTEAKNFEASQKAEQAAQKATDKAFAASQKGREKEIKGIQKEMDARQKLWDEKQKGIDQDKELRGLQDDIYKARATGSLLDIASAQENYNTALAKQQEINAKDAADKKDQSKITAIQDAQAKADEAHQAQLDAFQEIQQKEQDAFQASQAAHQANIDNADKEAAAQQARAERYQSQITSDIQTLSEKVSTTHYKSLDDFANRNKGLIQQIGTDTGMTFDQVKTQLKDVYDNGQQVFNNPYKFNADGTVRYKHVTFSIDADGNLQAKTDNGVWVDAYTTTGENTKSTSAGNSAGFGAAGKANKASGFASGGHIRGPGTGTSDSIPAMLSDGEYVVKASSVKKYGTGFMNAVNKGHYANGGEVGGPSPAGVPSTTGKTSSKSTTATTSSGGQEAPSEATGSIRSYADSLKYAMSQVGVQGWHGLCQSLARTIAGADAFGGSAWEAWNSMSPSHKHSGSPPPSGAIAYWGNKYPGHATWVIGKESDGTTFVVSNDAPESGTVGKVPWNWFASNWGMNYNGWIDSTPSGNLPIGAATPAQLSNLGLGTAAKGSAGTAGGPTETTVTYDKPTWKNISAAGRKTILSSLGFWGGKPGKNINNVIVGKAKLISDISPNSSGTGPASSGGTPTGNRAVGKQMAAKYGWGSGAQWNALDFIWQHESGWSTSSYDSAQGRAMDPQDPTGTARLTWGIPQANPGHKMAKFGKDWVTNPATQIAWGLDYIKHGGNNGRIGPTPLDEYNFGISKGRPGVNDGWGWYADGGHISGPGGPREDRIPAMLSNGEFVIRAASVSKYGKQMLDAINNGTFDYRVSKPMARSSMAGPRSNDSSSLVNSNVEYNINVNVEGSNATPEQIANVVIKTIKQKERANNTHRNIG